MLKALLVGLGIVIIGIYQFTGISPIEIGQALVEMALLALGIA